MEFSEEKKEFLRELGDKLAQSKSEALGRELSDEETAEAHLLIMSIAETGRSLSLGSTALTAGDLLNINIDGVPIPTLVIGGRESLTPTLDGSKITERALESFELLSNPDLEITKPEKD